MTGSRLSLALADGALPDPARARIAVFGAGSTTDISALPRGPVQVIQRMRPDFDAVSGAGYDCAVQADGRYSAALVSLPRSKADARDLIARASALVDDGPVLVDGQKTDGIDSLLKACRKRADVAGVVSKAHGKLFWMTGGDFSDWIARPLTLSDGCVTVPGVFSADGPDPGSVALAQALPPRLPGKAVDLGAGWGYLSRAALGREGLTELHLVEADHAALECARKNVTDPRASFHWADAARFGEDASFDTVITNPPFHTGRSADTALGRSFVAAAARLLKPSGKLWLVANRHLPYEGAARELFAEVKEIGGTAAFKILFAAKPRRGRR